MAPIENAIDSDTLGLRDLPEGEFQPCARYYKAMDFLLYLQEDVSYRADRVDGFLTLLWHPYERRAVGVKLKGFRFLFRQLQAIVKAQEQTLSDRESILSAIEVAMTVGLGSNLTNGVERKRVMKSYATAKSLVKSVRFDRRELKVDAAGIGVHG